MKKIIATLFSIGASFIALQNNAFGQCLSCPNSDFTISVTANWQTHNSSITSLGCKIYKVAVTSGRNYTFKTGCGDSATSAFDTYLELYNSTCSQIAYDDDGCEATRSKIVWVADSSGFVYLKVRGYGSAGTGGYTLAYSSCDVFAQYNYNLDTLGNVSVSDSSVGNVTSWLWDYGDSTYSNIQNPAQHQYHCGGSFNLSLTVIGQEGCSSTKTNNIYITPSFFAQFTDSISGTTVYFKDITEGNIVSWNWDFGDSTFSSDPNPTHTYTCPSWYFPTLTVTNSEGCSQSYTDYLSLSGSIANFTTVQTGTTVNFSNNSTGNLVHFQWDFGDNSPYDTTNIDVQHTYNCPGNYYVYFDVTTDQGCSDSYSSSIEVEGDFAANFSYTTSGNTVSFQDLSIGNISSYFWNFDDNTSDFSQNPTHTFGCGSFYVSLTVASGGCTDEIYQNIDVNTPLAITVSSNSPVCQGSSLNLNTPTLPSGIYTWSGPNGFSSSSQNPVLNNVLPIAAGSYTLNAQSDGCQGQQSTTVNITPVNLVVTTTGTTLTSAATTGTYQWVNCTNFNPIPTQTNSSFTALSNGNYAIIVTQEGCTDTSDCFPITNVGIGQELLNHLVQVFPNPSSGIFNVTFSGLPLLGNDVLIEISNLIGESITIKSTEAGGGLILDLSHQVNGVYFLKIQTKYGLGYKRITKE